MADEPESCLHREITIFGRTQPGQPVLREVTDQDSGISGNSAPAWDTDFALVFGWSLGAIDDNDLDRTLA